MKKLFALAVLLLAASAHAQGVGPGLWGRGGSAGMTAAGAAAATGWTSNGTTTSTGQIVAFTGANANWTFSRTGDDLLLKNGSNTTATWSSATGRPDFAFGVDSTGNAGFRSSSTSGNPAFSVLANGARVDFGTGVSDYASSNGTTVTFAGPIAAAAITSSAADGATALQTNEGSIVCANGAGCTAGQRKLTSSGRYRFFAVDGLEAAGDTTSPVKSAFRIEPQDAEPTGANAVGDMYVTTAGVLKICTVAGTPGTWVSVGAQ